MKRRSFLAGSLAIGVTVAFTACSKIPAIPRRPMPNADAASGWIRFVEGRYELVLPRVEIGQNISTGLKQIACEELGIDWDALDVIPHATTQIDRVKSTVGSESVKDFALPLAQACATLRDAVVNGTAEGEIAVIEHPTNTLRSFARQTKFVGQPVPLEQGDAIVQGQPLYTADSRPDKMVFGRVLRAPASPELISKPAFWNAAAARKVPGYAGLVQDKRFTQANSIGLGILAETPSALDRIADALDVKWNTEGRFDQSDIDRSIDIDQRLAEGSLSYTIEKDNIDQDILWDVDFRFDIPLAAHGPIEPRAAIAEFDERGALKVWAGTQDAFYTRDVLAKTLSMNADDIIVQTNRVGGAFGGKTICTVEQEAAVLAQAAGRPVKVQWTRAQEYQSGFHRPPSSHRIRALVRNGKLENWWHGFASSHILFTNAAMPQWMQNFTDFIGDPGVARGADLAYNSEAKRIEYDLIRLPVFTGPWRGLGAGPNTLAIESAIDECAYHAGTDPIAFRRGHIQDPQLLAVLDRVANRAGWYTQRRSIASERRTGRGVACGIYKKASYAAVIADVEVSANGVPKVTQLWCAHDCGQVINPDQVRAQCEGNLVWGLGMVLSDRLGVEESQIAAETFADAPIPQMSAVPIMTIDLIDSTMAPAGAGETAIVAASGAVANAVRAATGIRPTRFPLDPKEFALSPA